jgi:putative transposase
VLRAENQLAHRPAERVAHKRSKPRAACATEPNQLFTWDISYLPTTVHGLYLYLYIFLDVFSRKIVAWQIYTEESGENASEVLKIYVDVNKSRPVTIRTRNHCSKP